MKSRELLGLRDDLNRKYDDTRNGPGISDEDEVFAITRFTNDPGWRKYPQYASVTARVIFGTDDQIQNDHRSSQGSVASNGFLDDYTVNLRT